MNLLYRTREFLHKISGMHRDLDTVDAAARIQKSIWFRGANVWILACAIVVASVGLNVNSTAVIIGAMLISPVMGPILGIGLSVGTNDFHLLKLALKNLVVMVVISLAASCLYFLLSPLNLADPTELQARTSPTIYDVLIAFFGGLAGIVENSRKERGTVLSGVAIATALMPPLCTAGYGLAHWDMHYFTGALYLFVINSVFIALATYFMVKYLGFKTVSNISEELALRRHRVITTILVIILVPSIWSAFSLIRSNNFERNVQNFVENNRLVAPRTYIYDYRVQGRQATISLAGEPLDDELRASIYVKAGRYNIKQKDLTLQEHSFGLSQQDMDNIIEEIYNNTTNELDENQALLESMESRLEDLSLEIARLKEKQAQLEAAQSDSLQVL